MGRALGRRLGAFGRVGAACCRVACACRAVCRTRFVQRHVARLPEYRKVAFSLSKILLNYVQLLSTLQHFPGVRWPPLFRRFLEALDIFVFELFVQLVELASHVLELGLGVPEAE